MRDDAQEITVSLDSCCQQIENKQDLPVRWELVEVRYQSDGFFHQAHLLTTQVAKHGIFGRVILKERACVDTGCLRNFLNRRRSVTRFTKQPHSCPLHYLACFSL